MHHVTISTTGIFNAIRPSLFPPIEGKETTTFLLGLDFNTGGIIPFYDEGQDDVVVNGPHVELERQRIRAFVKAVCEEMGKPFEECRNAFLFSLPEFIRYGTYNGQPLLEKPRTGEYEAYVLYKSHRGRKLLFQQGRQPKDEVQYVFDNMLRYFITTLFSDEGTYGYLADVKHIETSLSLGVLQQSLEDIKAADEDIFSEGIDAFSVPNYYVMTEPTQVHSEFLLLADALGAYMVQAMDGETESDALKTLSRDRLLQNICESMYKMYMGPSEEAAIGVYDECERWLSPLIQQCWNSQYTMLRRTLKQVPTYDDGVLGFVKEQQVFPLVAHVIWELSTENLGVALRPKVHQYKQYLDVLVPYVDRVEDLYRKRYVGVGDDPFGMNKADDMPPVDVELCCHVYCALDACQRAIRGERMYHNVIPIVNFLDDLVAHADIPSPDSWLYEYMLKVGRLSKWYRALAYAFTGRSEAESLLKELIQAQEKDPLEYESCSDAFIYNLANPSSAFDLKYLQLALLHFYVETDNRIGYERYIETVYPPLFSMRFDWISQMHVLLNENGHEVEDEYTQGNHYWNYTNAVFLLWLKAVWHFHLDHMDQACWDELGTLWDATYDNPNYARHTQDHYAYLECVKYMVKLAVHFGDIRRAEMYKRNLQTLIDEEYKFGWAGAALGYPWNASDYSIMAQINESLGKLDLAKEQYDKTYALVSFAQDKWRYFEGKHGNIWDLPISVDPEATQPTLTEWLTNYIPKFSTIDEYKKALVSWMSYVFH
ncbi:hypothetical protein HMPREF9321_0853 [Veillonella atypica ACS-049-V-Sch6]|uniref:Uncharacterized protein n=2 Tax=Veillonella atypica TaxID=39777 RepID=E1L4U0_9FIRM|nr:hypothetical protein HMPREF9321_0853 [Veillonella atypica ACS-049-V-Sch6]